MRTLLLALLVALAGCANSTVEYIDPNGEPIKLTQRFGGRGCIAATTHTDGTVDVIVQQDGSSDWAGVRAIPAALQIALATLFGTRTEDPAEFPGPSDIQGCAGLFTIEETDDAEE